MTRLRHKPGRKSNYLKSLNNDHHREVRRQTLIRDGFKCKVCGSKIKLELHHITYFHNGKEYVGNELENMDWVVMLCETHHQQVHNNPNHVWNPNNRNKRSYNTIEQQH